MLSNKSLTINKLVYLCTGPYRVKGVGRTLVDIKIKSVCAGYGGRPANDTSYPSRWLPGLFEKKLMTLFGKF